MLSCLFIRVLLSLSFAILFRKLRRGDPMTDSSLYTSPHFGYKKKSKLQQSRPPLMQIGGSIAEEKWDREAALTHLHLVQVSLKEVNRFVRMFERKINKKKEDQSIEWHRSLPFAHLTAMDKEACSVAANFSWNSCFIWPFDRSLIHGCDKIRLFRIADVPIQSIWRGE